MTIEYQDQAQAQEVAENFSLTVIPSDPTAIEHLKKYQKKETNKTKGFFERQRINMAKLLLGSDDEPGLYAILQNDFRQLAKLKTLEQDNQINQLKIQQAQAREEAKTALEKTRHKNTAEALVDIKVIVKNLADKRDAIQKEMQKIAEQKKNTQAELDSARNNAKIYDYHGFALEDDKKNSRHSYSEYFSEFTPKLLVHGGQLFMEEVSLSGLGQQNKTTYQPGSASILIQHHKKLAKNHRPSAYPAIMILEFFAAMIFPPYILLRKLIWSKERAFKKAQIKLVSQLEYKEKRIKQGMAGAMYRACIETPGVSDKQYKYFQAFIKQHGDYTIANIPSNDLYYLGNFIKTERKKIKKEIALFFKDKPRQKYLQYLDNLLVEIELYKNNPDNKDSIFKLTIDDKESKKFIKNFNNDLININNNKITAAPYTGLFDTALPTLLGNKSKSKVGDFFISEYTNTDPKLDLPSVDNNAQANTAEQLGKFKVNFYLEKNKQRSLEFLESFIKKIEGAKKETTIGTTEERYKITYQHLNEIKELFFTEREKTAYKQLLEQCKISLGIEPRSPHALLNMFHKDAILGDFGLLCNEIINGGVSKNQIDKVCRYINVAMAGMDKTSDQAKIQTLDLLREIVKGNKTKVLTDDEKNLIKDFIPSYRLEENKHIKDIANYLISQYTKCHLKNFLLEKIYARDRDSKNINDYINPQVANSAKVQKYLGILKSISYSSEDKSIESYEHLIEIAQNYFSKIFEETEKQFGFKPEKNATIKLNGVFYDLTYAELLTQKTYLWFDNTAKGAIGSKINAYINKFDGSNSTYALVMGVVGNETQIKNWFTKRINYLFAQKARTEDFKLKSNAGFLDPRDIDFLESDAFKNNPENKNSLNKAIEEYIIYSNDAKPPISWDKRIADIIEKYGNDENKQFYRAKRIGEFLKWGVCFDKNNEEINTQGNFRSYSEQYAARIKYIPPAAEEFYLYCEDENNKINDDWNFKGEKGKKYIENIFEKHLNTITGDFVVKNISPEDWSATTQFFADEVGSPEIKEKVSINKIKFNLMQSKNLNNIHEIEKYLVYVENRTKKNQNDNNDFPKNYMGDFIYADGEKDPNSQGAGQKIVNELFAQHLDGIALNRTLFIRVINGTEPNYKNNPQWNKGLERLFTAFSNDQNLKELRFLRIRELLAAGSKQSVLEYIALVRETKREPEREYFDDLFKAYDTDYKAEEGALWMEHVSLLIDAFGTKDRQDSYLLKKLEEELNNNNPAETEKYLLKVRKDKNLTTQDGMRKLISDENRPRLDELLTQYSKKSWNVTTDMLINQFLFEKKRQDYNRKLLREVMLEGKELDLYKEYTREEMEEIKRKEDKTSSKNKLYQRQEGEILLGAEWKTVFGESGEAFSDLAEIFEGYIDNLENIQIQRDALESKPVEENNSFLNLEKNPSAFSLCNDFCTSHFFDKIGKAYLYNRLEKINTNDYGREKLKIILRDILMLIKKGKGIVTEDILQRESEQAPNTEIVREMTGFEAAASKYEFLGQIVKICEDKIIFLREDDSNNSTGSEELEKQEQEHRKSILILQSVQFGITQFFKECIAYKGREKEFLNLQEQAKIIFNNLNNQSSPEAILSALGILKTFNINECTSSFLKNRLVKIKDLKIESVNDLNTLKMFSQEIAEHDESAYINDIIDYINQLVQEQNFERCIQDDINYIFYKQEDINKIYQVMNLILEKLILSKDDRYLPDLSFKLEDIEALYVGLDKQRKRQLAEKFDQAIENMQTHNHDAIQISLVQIKQAIFESNLINQNLEDSLEKMNKVVEELKRTLQQEDLLLQYSLMLIAQKTPEFVEMISHLKDDFNFTRLKLESLFDLLEDLLKNNIDDATQNTLKQSLEEAKEQNPAADELCSLLIDILDKKPAENKNNIISSYIAYQAVLDKLENYTDSDKDFVADSQMFNEIDAFLKECSEKHLFRLSQGLEKLADRVIEMMRNTTTLQGLKNIIADSKIFRRHCTDKQKMEFEFWEEINENSYTKIKYVVDQKQKNTSMPDIQILKNIFKFNHTDLPQESPKCFAKFYHYCRFSSPENATTAEQLLRSFHKAYKGYMSDERGVRTSKKSEETAQKAQKAEQFAGELITILETEISRIEKLNTSMSVQASMSSQPEDTKPEDTNTGILNSVGKVFYNVANNINMLFSSSSHQNNTSVPNSPTLSNNK